MKTLPLSEAKAKLSRLVKDVASRDERILITRNGRAAAVLLSPDELESLEETLEIMSDPKLMAKIRRGIRELESGAGLWWDLDDLDENFRPKPGRKARRLPPLKREARRSASARR